jgi:hypothetical protein
LLSAAEDGRQRDRVTMMWTGTVSDFDTAGLFGLIIEDDGDCLPFNLRETPLAVRTQFKVGTRVRFTKRASEPIARAVEVAPIGAPYERRP